MWNEERRGVFSRRIEEIKFGEKRLKKEGEEMEKRIKEAIKKVERELGGERKERKG